MTSEKRRHERIQHRAQIRVMTHPENVYILEMNDFSESGLFLLNSDPDLVCINDKVEVQTLEIENAPVIPSRVVRIDKHGFAVEFILD